MRVPFRLMIAVCALTYVASFATGQDNPFSKLKGGEKNEGWKGQRIYPKWPAAKIRFWDETDKGRIDHKLSSDFPLQVVRDDGEKVRVRDGDNEGWVAKADYIKMFTAEHYFAGRVDGNPKDGHAHKELALAELDLHNYEEARKALDVFIKLQPKDPDGYMLRMEAWEGQFDYDKAIEDSDEWIRLMPGKDGPIAKRAELRSLNRDYVGALKDYETVIQISPKNAYLYYLRGKVHALRRAFDKQVADLDTAIKLEPGSATYLATRGGARARALDLKGALDDLNEAVRLAPKANEYRYNLACLLLLSRGKDACTAFEKLRDEVKARNDFANFAAIYAHFAARQAGDAKLAEEGLKAATAKIVKYWPLPLVQYLNGELAEADVIKKAATDGAMEAHCAIGVHLMLKGDSEGAVKHFQWVRDKGDVTYFDHMMAVVLLDRIEKEKAAPKKK